MNKLQTVWMTALLLFFQFAKAQTLDEGKKYLYYEKYQSAKTVFQKLVDANPQQAEAVYYLGLSIILNEDCTDAELKEVKQLYQTKLQLTNDPLLIAGIGHIELVMGNANEAKRQFEAAAGITERKNLAVLKAIGLANSNPLVKYGDAAYAIAILEQARTLKKFKDPEALVYLGNAHKKNGDYSSALYFYVAALDIDPNYAKANSEIIKVNARQGISKESVILGYFNKAVAGDPQYAPVYFEMYNFYYKSDIKKAAEYFENWLKLTDANPKICFYRSAIKYAQGLFLEAISTADKCILEEKNNVYPNIYGLKANAYDRLQDSVNAVVNYLEYFKRQKPEKITSADYLECSQNMAKIAGMDSLAGIYAEKSIAIDTLESSRVATAKTYAKMYEAKKKYKDAARWYSKVMSLKSKPDNVDISNIGYSYYRSGLNDSAMVYFSSYASKYPNDIYGHYMSGKVSWAIDSTLTLGLATPYFEKTIQIGLTDTSKFKNQLIFAYKYYFNTSLQINKDKVLSMSYLDKILALDPNEAEALRSKSLLKQPAQAPKKKP